MNICDWCGEEYEPVAWIGSAQRFCCREHSNEWHQQERRQAVAWFRDVGMTVETPANLRAAE